MIDQVEDLRVISSRKRLSDFDIVSDDNVMPISNKTSKPSVPLKSSSRVIALTSGKGGVGKSTLSVNLGISLVQKGAKVLLLDGDFGLANVNILMGIIPDYNIYDVVRGKKRLRDTIISTSFGLDIIAGANGISQLADIGYEERRAFLEQLEDLEHYDMVLIDTGAGIGMNVVSFALASDEILVVTTPEPTSITDAYAMIKSIVVRNSKKRVRLVVNRAPSATEARCVAERLKSIATRFLYASVDLLGFVLEEDLVQKSIRNQRPLVTSYPNSKSAICLAHIGRQLLLDKEKNNSNGLLSFFRNMMGGKEKDTMGIFK